MSCKLVKIGRLWNEGRCKGFLIFNFNYILCSVRSKTEPFFTSRRKDLVGRTGPVLEIPSERSTAGGVWKIKTSKIQAKHRCGSAGLSTVRRSKRPLLHRLYMYYYFTHSQVNNATVEIYLSLILRILNDVSVNYFPWRILTASLRHGSDSATYARLLNEKAEP